MTCSPGSSSASSAGKPLSSCPLIPSSVLNPVSLSAYVTSVAALSGRRVAVADVHEYGDRPGRTAVGHLVGEPDAVLVAQLARVDRRIAVRRLPEQRRA